MGRIVLNHPVELAIAVFSLLIAVIPGALLPVLTGRTVRGVGLAGATLALVIGILTLTYAASDSANDLQRPRITSSLSLSPTGFTLKGTVEETGITNDEHLLVNVEGRSANDILSPGARHAGHTREGEPTPPKTPNGDYVQDLLIERAGPSADGTVKPGFTAAIGTGLYDQTRVHSQVVKEGVPAQATCDATTAALGCETINLPPAPARPQLTIDAIQPSSITASVKMETLSTDDRGQLTIRRLTGQTVYFADLSPDEAGRVAQKVTAPIPKTLRAMRMTARFAQAGRVQPNAGCVSHSGRPASAMCVKFGRLRLDTATIELRR